MELSGRTALLTGATGGLGRAIAQALAERGASLVLSSRKAGELERMAADLPEPDGGMAHRAVSADLAVEGAALKLVDEAGDVDVLVANAGLPASGRFDSFSQEEISEALRVNLESPIRMARELAPKMAERGEGHLVFVSSLAGKAASPRASIYSATKFGLRGFAICLRADLGGSGVGASLISPGFIREAGMFADGGGDPRFLGTSSPQEVGAAVVRAIERDKLEIAVAPLRQRALAHFALAAPGPALRALS
ncbi:MAG: SDR family NAD(P)-dependent oxidoreductase [Actinomycetota bacterium]